MLLTATDFVVMNNITCFGSPSFIVFAKNARIAVCRNTIKKTADDFRLFFVKSRRFPEDHTNNPAYFRIF